MKNSNKRKQQKGNIFTKTLRRQILIPIVLLILFAGGAVAAVSYHFSVKIATNELLQSVQSQMKGTNETFELFFENMDGLLQQLSQNELILVEDEKSIISYLENIGETNNFTSSVYITEESSGKTSIYPVVDLGSDFDGRTRTWYQQAVEANGETVWTEPYVDLATGEWIVSGSRAVYDQGELVGVAGMDVLTGTLVTMVNNIEIGESGFGLILDQHGTYIAHSDSGKIGESAQNEAFYTEISTNENGTLNYGEENMMVFTKNPTTNWTLGGTISQSEIQSKTGSALGPIIIGLLIVLVIGNIAATLVANQITKAIRSLQEKMERVEKGDLSTKVENHRVDEIGQLSRSFQNMIDQMKRIVLQISSVSKDVTDASQTLVASVEENSAATSEVATTMGQMAAGAGEQVDIMEKNTIALEEMTDRMQEVEKQNRHMHEEGLEMEHLTKQGMETIDKLRQQSTETNDMTKDVIQAIKRLDHSSTSINEIVNKISDIANQTNLLALNASIEAARAGEHGKGFAVVANEVGKLADQTGKALADVTTLISTMQEDTKHTVSIISKTSDAFQMQTESVDATETAFHRIQEMVQTINATIKETVESMNEMVQKEKEFSDQTLQITTISQEAAAGIEEISASTEEQHASMEQLNQLAINLEIYASQLQDEISQFRVEVKN